MPELVVLAEEGGVRVFVTSTGPDPPQRFRTRAARPHPQQIGHCVSQAADSLVITPK